MKNHKLPCKVQAYCACAPSHACSFKNVLSTYFQVALSNLYNSWCEYTVSINPFDVMETFIK